MVVSLEASLRRLRTDRIDLYWAHYADGVTPVEEIVRGFDDLVRGGKILYAGLSDFPAWRVARAATIAELRGFGADRRAPGRAQPGRAHDGAGTAADGPGARTRHRRLVAARRRHAHRQVPPRRGRPRRGLGGRVFQPENSPQRTAILDTVIAVAEETGATPSQVAIAWVASKGPLPIIGPRTLEQLGDNLGATRLQLTPEQLARLDEASAIPPVFPYTVVDHREYRHRATGGKLDQLDLPTVPVA